MTLPSSRVLARAAATTTTVAAAAVLAAGSASAHVVASGTGTAQGGYGVVTLRVPTESETAATVGLTVTLPTDTPLGSVRTTPVPGWTSTVALTPDKTPTSITWTADPGGGLPPGQFQQFLFTAGPLPSQPELALPSVQRYSDGSEVAWNEPTPAGGEEPEHPTPTLALSAATGDDGAASATVTPTAAPSDQAASSSTGSTSDSGARWLGGAGLVLGAVGLVAGVGALARTRRRS